MVAQPKIPVVLPERRERRQGEFAAVQVGFPNAVDRKLGRMHIPERCRQFLSVVRPRSFGAKGFQERDGRDDPGLSCRFVLRQFVVDLDWRPKDVLYVRDQLVALRIICFASDGPGTGTGRLYWNTNLDEWESSGWGGRRANAGNPQWKASGHNQLDRASEHSQLDRDFIQDGNDPHSRWERAPIKLGMDARSEPAPAIAASAPVRKTIFKKRRRTSRAPLMRRHALSFFPCFLVRMNNHEKPPPRDTRALLLLRNHQNRPK